MEEVEKNVEEWHSRMEINVRPRRRSTNMWKDSKKGWKSFVEDSICEPQCAGVA